ncbi:hypothetical protein E3N88_24345 [Mikania micrantha]|uniref:Aminotransferase-like plant mobile domain-containing protein n=1 Tax=Mikania micrantha TaxID=192012 RepID=A0A5N6N272_9ASTR|nr:hypothetical protein E3N88_24345 [Mikania micrantha]
MNMNLHLIPGPMDDRVLYLGAKHQARNLFLNPQEGESCTMDFRRGDGSFWRLDRALIEALVERWRPETNTFHLPFGEATVTLEDVNVEWGLPIEGVALTGVEGSYTYDESRHMCLTYLGYDTQPNDYRNHLLKLSNMLSFMLDNPITDDSTDEECMQRARCVCLILVTNNVLADTNNGYVSLHLLSHLTDSRQLSWGAAALASLYRELYKGTNPQKSIIGGPMSLLQIWAWTRIHTLAPRIVDEQIDWRKPYGASASQLRKTQRKGRLETDLSVHHALYVENWNHRRENMVEGVPTNTPTTHHTYNDWFHRHTVLYIKDPRQVHGVIHTGFDDHGGTARYLVDGLGFIGQEALKMRNMGPDHYYENFGGVQSMASQLIGSINHIDQPSYIQTNEPDLGPDNTHPQRAPRDRGRHGRQRTRVNLIQNDDEGEGARHFEGATLNYGEGTSNWEECYRPSSQFVGHGSSNIQLGTKLNVNNNQQNNWVSSLFDCTPSSNVIPAMYSDQQGPFQNYDYTGLSVQQPRYEHLTPVQITLDLQLTQPEGSSPPNDNEPEKPQPRRIQPRRSPKPVGCGTAGCLMRYPHRH